MKKIILLMSIFAISCNNDDNSNSGETNCTDQFVYGLHVSVKNAVTNAVASRRCFGESNRRKLC